MDLPDPVVADGLGAEHEVLAKDTVLFLEIGEIGDSLDSFSEAHVVSQYSVGVLRGQIDHPL